MPRTGRVIFPGVPHHVTQRGNHRERVFHEPGDADAYLGLLRAEARDHEVEVVAYCLMPNHVHLVIVPSAAMNLHRMLMAVNGQYAQRINRMRGQNGHLWQGRYFSSPLDENYFVNAVRYVELNPVRAGLVVKAEDYPWSSAPAHCGIRIDPHLRSMRDYGPLRAIAKWSEWLAEGTSPEVLDALRLRAGRNLPCGSDAFVSDLERMSGRELRVRKRGGQPKFESY